MVKIGGKKRKIKAVILPFNIIVFFAALLSSCSINHHINKAAKNILLGDTIIGTGHIGISIYEPATNKYWYRLDADKYFVPASNTKLFTTYAAMKYLGDSLIGLKYFLTDTAVHIYPTADPSFLHPDFKQQIVFDFLKQQKQIIYHTKRFSETLGKGWAWDDYLERYMVQRAELPLYGNLIRLYKNDGETSIIPKTVSHTYIKATTNNFYDTTHFAERNWDDNELQIKNNDQNIVKEIIEIPLVANWQKMIGFLQDTLHKKVKIAEDTAVTINKNDNAALIKIYSQPTDSLLKPMLFNSDNFFAEQCLLMVSNQQLGYMNIEKIIDTILKNYLNNLAQKPRWVDGSGLSRYNLFTPSSFVFILNKMINEFGAERLKRILPTGGEGTLKNYFLKDTHFIFAKTGSMSNHTAISGLLYTKKGKLLLFSILANQFIGSASHVRHAVESFLEGIRQKY